MSGNVQKELISLATNRPLSLENLPDDIISAFESAGFTADEILGMIFANVDAFQNILSSTQNRYKELHFLICV